MKKNLLHDLQCKQNAETDPLLFYSCLLTHTQRTLTIWICLNTEARDEEHQNLRKHRFLMTHIQNQNKKTKQNKITPLLTKPLLPYSIELKQN
jgi:hypothetical protein